jgi:hypothetical protein
VVRFGRVLSTPKAAPEVVRKPLPESPGMPGVNVSTVVLQPLPVFSATESLLWLQEADRYSSIAAPGRATEIYQELGSRKLDVRFAPGGRGISASL